MSRHYSLSKIGFPDYAIDKSGNIYSGKKHYRGRKLRPTNRNGYLAVTLRNKKESKSLNIHRVLAIIFIPCKGNIKDFQVNHIDGDKTNNCLKNLEWCSAKENAAHRDKLKLQKRKYNEEANRWRLYNKEIKIIKKLYSDYGLKQTQIAELFEVNQGYVSQVVRGKRRAKAIESLKGEE